MRGDRSLEAIKGRSGRGSENAALPATCLVGPGRVVLDLSEGQH